MANVKKASPKKAKPSTVRPRTTRTTAVAAEPAREPVGMWRHLVRSLGVFGRHWQYFVLFLVVYGVLNLLLAHNLVSGVADTKSSLNSLLGNSAWASIGTYTLLLTSTTTGSSSSAAAYQYILFIIGSLALIWALRQFSATEAKPVRVLDSFYSGMAPLIPFVLTLVVLTLELTPFVLAGALYATVISNGVVSNLFEQVLWLLLFLAGAGLTLWLLARSLFGLYIVTLPGSRPIRSLKDSFRVTRAFQWAIIRKLLLLIVIILLVGAVCIVPVIAFVPQLTAIVVFVFSIALVPFVHTYCYGMYKDALV